MPDLAIVVDRRDNILPLEAYALPTFCKVCSEKHISLFCLGQKPKADDPYDRCPQCHCAGCLYYGQMQEAHRLMEGRQLAFFYDDPKDGFVQEVLPMGVNMVTPRVWPAYKSAASAGASPAKSYDNDNNDPCPVS